MAESQLAKSAAGKDTIYIDPEDEITVIIEKVRESKSKVVALVLPKRAATLQSVVNLKLLKRTADQSKKNIVLITSESSLLPVAGAVGLHVAKTLQSKPEIPPTPTAKSSSKPSTITVDESKVDLQTAVGELAGQAATEETIELESEVEPDAVGAAAVVPKKNKKLKIPDFNRFRLMLFGGIALLILLIVGGVFAFVVLPKAKIVIKTDSASVSTELALTAKTAAKELDKDNKIIPATKKELKKTEQEKVPATGQRDDGTKAKGTVTLTLTDCSQPEVTVPAGTGISANNLTFVTQSSTTLISTVKGGKCNNDSDASDTVPVVAQAAGDKYNLGARTYTVNGFSNVSGNGSTMSGGTSKITQIVSQTDVDGAKQKVLERLNTAATAELKAQFRTEDLLAIDDTYRAGDPTVASTPNVNNESSEVTVTVTVTYTELGVKKNDVKTLITDNVNKQIDTSKQTILDDGLNQAVIRVSNNKSADEASFTVSTITLAGPQLDEAGIKREIAGKKKGQAQSIVKSRPGITDVTITYSPFWVYSTPKNVKHITVTFDQSNANQ